MPLQTQIAMVLADIKVLSAEDPDGLDFETQMQIRDAEAELDELEMRF